MQGNPFRRSAPLVVFAAVLLMSACGEPKTAGGPGGGNNGAPGQQPAPSVGVITVHPESVPQVTELPGRTAPFLVAEVRPQVTGVVLRREFEEGSEVKADQVLYRIDPAPYRAAFESAKANVARAEANVYATRLTAKRYAALIKTHAISQQANDEAVAALRQAEAEVAAAKAALQAAQINLDFTEVKSPIGGRIGRSSVTAGALVTADQSEALAIVRQLDPIYVDLTQSSAELLRLKREFAAGQLQRAADASVPVRLLLEDGSEYAHEGKLAFAEVAVDESTGSVTLRALVPNPDGELLPHMYVRARLAQGMHPNAILVPHAAVTHDPKGQSVVMVVDAENKVEARTVRTAQSLADKWVVTDGLAAGERVIVEGLQRARPGSAVRAQEQAAQPAAAPPGTAASPAAAPPAAR